MTDVYVVIEHDRHRDPEPSVFDTLPEAIAFARHIASDWLQEQDTSGFLYLALHPTESDMVWVVQKTINDWGDPR